MECVTTVRYRVRFNGVLLNTIQPTCGLRQGDPLSPYLFLFVDDGLSKLLQQGNRAGAIQGLKVCRNALVVSHLLFADDNLLFFRADEEQSRAVKEVLSRYCKATGQLINFNKCSVLFNKNQGDANMNAVKNELSIYRDTFEAKYLGLPLPTPEGRLKADRFSQRVE